MPPRAAVPMRIPSRGQLGLSHRGASAMRRIAGVRQLLVLCIAATAAGCGQDDGEASSAPKISKAVVGFVRDVAETACNSLKSCCTSIDVKLDSAGCKRVVPATLRLYYSSRVELKESKVSQCLEQVSEALAKCKGTWPPSLSACHAALAGTVPQGQQCSFDFECSAVKGRLVACSKGRCTTRDEEDDQGAAPVSDWGQTCSSGADCEGTCEGGYCTPGALLRTCAGETLPVGPISGTGGDLCIPGAPCPQDSEECVYDSGEHRYQCQPAGGANMPCHGDETCDGEDLACADGLCLKAGGEDEPCRSDGTCDKGLGCIASHECGITAGLNGTTECCLGKGESNDPCNEQRGCATGYECRSDTSCMVPATSTDVDSCCVEVGGRGQPCPEKGACDEGLECGESSSCTGSFGSASECCIETGTVRNPCKSDGTCGPGLACAGTGSSCPYGEPCCVYAGGTNEPCYDDDTCDESLSCVPCDDGSCCQPVGGDGQECYGDGSCNAGLVCSVSPECTRSGIGLAACCLHAGQDGEPCLEDGTCEAADTACLSFQDVFSGSSYFECVGMGGPGEPCREDDSCEAGSVCVQGYGGCGANDCCVVSGALGQPCNADGTCDADTLMCQNGTCIPEM